HPDRQRPDGNQPDKRPLEKLVEPGLRNLEPELVVEGFGQAVGDAARLGDQPQQSAVEAGPRLDAGRPRPVDVQHQVDQRLDAQHDHQHEDPVADAVLPGDDAPVQVGAQGDDHRHGRHGVAEHVGRAAAQQLPDLYAGHAGGVAGEEEQKQHQQRVEHEADLGPLEGRPVGGQAPAPGDPAPQAHGDQIGGREEAEEGDQPAAHPAEAGLGNQQPDAAGLLLEQRLSAAGRLLLAAQLFEIERLQGGQLLLAEDQQDDEPDRDSPGRIQRQRAESAGLQPDRQGERSARGHELEGQPGQRGSSAPCVRGFSHFSALLAGPHTA
ncbi:MAG: hypothetical protein DRO11_09830, partial [Methanobacteriota archaeon]